MNLSTHPLPARCLTNDGLEAMPRVLSSAWNAGEMNYEPWSCRSAVPSAMLVS
jgi:hypothetical protein